MKQYYEALFLSDTDLRQNAIVHNFAIQIALVQYSGRSKHAWAFSETVKTISKITYTPAGSHFWIAPNLQWQLSVWMDICRVPFQHNKELIMFISYLERCVIFKSVWYARHFEYSCKRCTWTRSGSKIILWGVALVSCSTSTPINHILFFLPNTSCIRKPQVISGGGGCAPPAPSP